MDLQQRKTENGTPHLTGLFANLNKKHKSA